MIAFIERSKYFDGGMHGFQTNSKAAVRKSKIVPKFPEQLARPFEAANIQSFDDELLEQCRKDLQCAEVVAEPDDSDKEDDETTDKNFLAEVEQSQWGLP